MTCTPLEPVPITPTRLPATSTPSAGQRAVWCWVPSNVSAPGIGGLFTSDRQPAADTRNRAETVAPSDVSTIQRFRSSSKRARSTRVPNCMSPRRSKRSAT